jgi:hypothetical protein
MGLSSRLLTGFLIGSALLLTFASLSAEWVLEASTVTDSTGQRISLWEAYRQGQRLSRAVQETKERTAAKERIADMVAGNEITLIEAAAWFRALHRTPDSWNNIMCPRPGEQEGKEWCCLVITYVEMKTRNEQSVSQAEFVKQRLQADLQEQLDRHGNIELPE